MSLSLWIAYYEKIQIDDSNPYSLSTSSQFIRYHVLFLARSLQRVTTEPTPGRGEESPAARAALQRAAPNSARQRRLKEILKGEIARCWPNWPNPWNWPSKHPTSPYPTEKGKCQAIVGGYELDVSSQEGFPLRTLPESNIVVGLNS